MTPAARVQSAIEILDNVVGGMPAEQALTRWARGSRFAGSKDRRAVRDHVFDVLRQRRSCAAWGGGETGRALMIGLLRLADADLSVIFTGERHQPEALSEDELARGKAPETAGEQMDLPDWIVPAFEQAFGDQAIVQARLMRQRAPVYVRVNTLKTDRDQAVAALNAERIEARFHASVSTALELGQGATKLRNSAAFQTGLVELQDASSQEVVTGLPDIQGTILDMCAGGGGKSLALAARYRSQIDAWDKSLTRMADLPARASRAGADVTCLQEDPSGTYGLVLCDAPCSGSGAWRRSPDAKWRLSQADVDHLAAVQDAVLEAAHARVAPDGVLAYVTCSVLTQENEDRVNAFIKRHPEWRCDVMRRWDLTSGGDGFFAAHLKRAKT